VIELLTEQLDLSCLRCIGLCQFVDCAGAHLVRTKLAVHALKLGRVDGRYSTPSDYVRDLIRSDRKRLAKERLDQLLLEGLDTPAEEVTPEYLENLRRDAGELIVKKRARGV
jgi:antitoxin ParD1/3/4